MIHLAADGTLSGELAPGVRAYFDAEWLAGAPATPVPALLIEGEPDADRADATAYATLAAFAAGLVRPTAGLAPVEVLGHGLLAALVRERVRAPRLGRDEPPAAIVDTTGEQENIVEATRRVTSGGVVVLGGESLGRPLEINLYKDVHVRGLRVFGVARPAVSAGPVSGSMTPPVAVTPGDVVPLAPWYRFEA